MLRPAALLLTVPLLCGRQATSLLAEGGSDGMRATAVLPSEGPPFPDLVVATRFAGTVSAGWVVDRWLARSTDRGWAIAALPEPRRSIGPAPDLWLGVARKTSDHENYDFLMVRWWGLLPLEAQVGRLEGGRDASGERRRGLRPWSAQRLDLRTGARTRHHGELLLGPHERSSGAAAVRALH